MGLSDVTVDWQCPSCTGSLQTTDRGLSCSTCGAAWPGQAGVWRFGEHSGYPLDFSQEQTAELVAIAQSQGWQVAMHDHMRRLSPTRYRRAIDEYAAQWRCLIPSHGQTRALVFRCGWGTAACALGDDYPLVVAADTNYQLAAFTALRAAATGRGSVQAVSLNPSRPWPFPTGYFDTVVIQDLLEWESGPSSCSAGLVREAARVIGPAGQLFLLARNSLNPMQWLQLSRKGGQGGGGQHLAVEFAPRPKFRPRTLSGYLRLLADAGLRPGSIYGLLPAVEEPFYMVPADRRGPIRFFLDSLFGSQSLHRALSQRHLLGPYYAARAVWNAARFLPLETLVGSLLPGYAILAGR